MKIKAGGIGKRDDIELFLNSSPGGVTIEQGDMRVALDISKIPSLIEALEKIRREGLDRKKRR